MDALNPEQREALQLWYLEGLGPSAMASRMKKSPDACRMLVGRALKNLRKHFDEGSDSHAA